MTITEMPHSCGFVAVKGEINVVLYILTYLLTALLVIDN